MALPAIADVRRALPAATIVVAARASVAPLFRFVDDVNDVIALEHPGPRSWKAAARALQSRGFDTALLLPNSLHAAVVAAAARIAERWGYRTDCRGPLLTRAVIPPSGLHQVEYYQQLVHALGFPNGPGQPRIAVPAAARDAGAALLRASGWNGQRPIVALAPGAAYGGAKRWPPERFAELAASLANDGVATVLVGSAGDAPTASDVARSVAAAGERHLLHNLVGRTDLAALAGVLACCRTLVTNDSGAMHLAAAAGVPVTAVFGPTNDAATRPRGPQPASALTVITHDVWCRPCMLRECPLDHRCMLGIAVPPVLAAARRNP